MGSNPTEPANKSERNRNIMDLSIICPVYNNKSTMITMMSSFCCQNIENLEIEYIFVCNGCTDNSEHMIRRYIEGKPQAFPHYSILSFDWNDVGRARQEGVNAAKGDYILFCDMDDWLLDTNMYQELLYFAHQAPGALVKFNFDLPKKDYFFIRDEKLYYTTYWRLKNRMNCTVWRYLFPREIFEKIEFHWGLNTEDDLDLTKQIEALYTAKEIGILIVPKDYYFWNYMRPGSYSHWKLNQNQMLTKEEFLQIINTLPREEWDEELRQVVDNLV